MNINITWKTFISVAIIATILLFITLNYAIDLSSFSIGIAKYIIAISLIWIVDSIAFRSVDTMELIKTDPKAYAIFFLANAIIMAACLGLS